MMDKKQFLEFIEKNYADDDVFGGLYFWTKRDVEENEERELSDDQFAEFDRWLTKYADGSEDYHEAVRHALGKEWE
jgi:hypothetical protein